MEFCDPDACRTELVENGKKQLPQLLFLKGLSGPQWLRKVAATLQVDPEFLNSNMLFRCRETYAAYPAPPSAYENIIRMRIPTIGRRENVRWGLTDPQRVAKLRSEAKEKMGSYWHELGISGVNIACGDSIVRDYHVLGERHFFLEQEVSVYLHAEESTWTG